MVFNPNDWSNYINLTIDSTLIIETLTNFPISVVLSSGTGTGITNYDTADIFTHLTVSGSSWENRKKIAVTTTVSGVEAELYVEISSWGTDNAFLWSKVGTISSGTDTYLKLYYDINHINNTTYIGDTGSVSARQVWDNNFLGVWHLEQDPTGGADCILDSTSNTNNGTPAGSMTAGDLVETTHGQGLDFDGNNDRVTFGALGSASQGTIEFIMDSSSITNYRNPFTTYYNGLNNAIRFEQSSAGALSVLVGNSTSYSQKAHTMSGTNNNISFAWKDNGDGYGYFDDTPAFVKNYAYVPTIFTNLAIGTGFSVVGERHFLGKIDEVRLSNVSRSSAWLKATYESNINTFITYGSSDVFLFSLPDPPDLTIAYGLSKDLSLYIDTNNSGTLPTYDATFYDSYDTQIGTTVSGLNVGSRVTIYNYTTTSGTDYSFYVIATLSGVENTSPLYTFNNKFLYSGAITAQGTAASGITTRLHLQSTGELIDNITTNSSGTFSLVANDNTEHYVIAIHNNSNYDALVHDRIVPTI